MGVFIYRSAIVRTEEAEALGSVEILSDSEEERQECEKTVEDMNSMVSKDAANAEADDSPESRTKAGTRLRCLRLARSLMQLHFLPKDDGSDASSPNDAAALLADAKNDPSMPQAREYITARGFSSWGP